MSVREIGRGEARAMVERHHYSGRLPESTLRFFGLFEGGAMVGCCAYGRGANPKASKWLLGAHGRQREVFELARLVVAAPRRRNLASRLIAGSARMLPPGNLLLSYADANWRHVGYIYQAANWLYLGEGAQRIPKLVYRGRVMHHRTLLSSGVAVDHGSLERVKQLPKHRYVYASGGPGQRRRMLRQLVQRPQPYPKDGLR